MKKLMYVAICVMAVMMGCKQKGHGIEVGSIRRCSVATLPSIPI